jgi:hypothetical protein
MAKRLHEKHLLFADEFEVRGTYNVRKQVQGRRQTTWHMRADTFGVGPLRGS